MPQLSGFHPVVNKHWTIQRSYGLDLSLFGIGTFITFFQQKQGTNALEYEYGNRLTGFIMILGWAAQVYGADMKRYTIAEELRQRGLFKPVSKDAVTTKKKDDDEEDNAFFYPALKKTESKIFFYLLIHPVISGVLFAMGMRNFLPELAGLVDEWYKNESGAGITFNIICMSSAALIPTIFVFRALVPPKTESIRKHPFLATPLAAFLADQLIVASFIILFSTIFGMPSMLEGTKPLMPSTSFEWSLVIIFIVPLLWIGLMFFYVPYRILIMYDSLGTWKNRLFCFLALSPIIYKYIAG